MKRSGSVRWTGCAGHAQDAVPQRRPVLRWTAAVAAAVMALVLLFVVLPSTATSYFTIDINPSISMEADSAGIILSVDAQNEDAQALLADLDLVGMPFLDAFRCIVRAAETEGYLKDNGHVLVAHFGTTAAVSETEIETAVQECTNVQVNVLLLQSGKQDYENARQNHQSAGISLLMRDAQRLGIDGADMDAIIAAMKQGGSNNHGSNPSQVNPNNNPGDNRPSATGGNNGRDDAEETQDSDDEDGAATPGQNDHGNGSGGNDNSGNNNHNNGSGNGHSNGQNDNSDDDEDSGGDDEDSSGDDQDSGNENQD